MKVQPHQWTRLLELEALQPATAHATQCTHLTGRITLPHATPISPPDHTTQHPTTLQTQCGSQKTRLTGIETGGLKVVSSTLHPTRHVPQCEPWLSTIRRELESMPQAAGVNIGSAHLQKSWHKLQNPRTCCLTPRLCARKTTRGAGEPAL